MPFLFYSFFFFFNSIELVNLLVATDDVINI